MSYFAKGDWQKTESSSEERLCFGLTENRQSVNSGIVTNDADCQFWAEDELSNSESKVRIQKRRKRKRNATYYHTCIIPGRIRSPHIIYTSSSSGSDTKKIKIYKVSRKKVGSCKLYHNKQIQTKN
ncbi:uncharacterized protein [Prorops nasuta]|uniref:uncharacterized protein isoform X2 n=1 Tax=Prorops nasuta TaxID=863751 RepID=UPI0034CDAA92